METFYFNGKDFVAIHVHTIVGDIENRHTHSSVFIDDVLLSYLLEITIELR